VYVGTKGLVVGYMRALCRAVGSTVHSLSQEADEDQQISLG